MPTPEEILAALEIHGIAKAPAADFEQANEARKLFLAAERFCGKRIERFRVGDRLYRIV